MVIMNHHESYYGILGLLTGMEQYKQDFIKFLLANNALKTSADPAKDSKLKSGRLSPWFLNLGDLKDGASSGEMGRAYAEATRSAGIDFDVMYGIPEKGITLVVATSIELARLGTNKPWFFTRKMPKDYGENTGSREAQQKASIVGAIPGKGNCLALYDDVLTTAQTKYDAIKDLNNLLEDPSYAVLVIAADREEVAPDGKSAIEEFARDTNIPVTSIIRARDVYQFLREDGRVKEAERLERYLRVYGTESVRGTLEKSLEQRIISLDRSVIPACDVETLEQLEGVVVATAGVPGIGGYKIGFELGLGYGLPAVVEVVKKHTDKPVIYDHQKAATDIPDTGKNFARVCKKAGVDAIILFPQAGPETERGWIYHALDQGLKVIVGGRMTHPAYAVSEGGFITDEGALEIYRIAARAGVNNFVVPGNKPEIIATIKSLVESEGVDPVLYAPGFVAQGGKISDAAKAAGKKWNAIVGRGIYEAGDVTKMQSAAEEHTSQLG